jgi:hypothetical protein
LATVHQLLSLQVDAMLRETESAGQLTLEYKGSRMGFGDICQMKNNKVKPTYVIFFPSAAFYYNTVSTFKVPGQAK